jgi:TonB family protein
MNKIAATALTILIAVILWHLIIWTKLPTNPQFSVNPITDVATVKLPSASSLGFTEPSAIAAFNGARDVVGAPIGERKLSNYAREYLDIYAMILPYHISITDQDAAPVPSSQQRQAEPDTEIPEANKYVNIPKTAAHQQRTLPESPEPITTPLEASPADGIYSAGGDVSAPIAIFTPEAEFSDEARLAKYNGDVNVAVVVGVDGKVQQANVLHDPGMGLSEKALQAVRQWRFKPSMKNGHAVAVKVIVSVSFITY